MVVLFLGCEEIKGLEQKLIGVDLVVLGFNGFTPQFLSEEYYFIVNKLKTLSLKNKTQFVFSFFINKTNKKYVGAVRIKGGRILNLFGECFSKKNLSFKIKNKTITVLFYYEIYSKIGKNIAKFSSLVVGLDDDEVFDQTQFISNKFNGKLVLIGDNLKISCGKLKIFKNKLKIC